MRTALAAALVVAACAALFAFQPLGSPWWTGHDFDSAYAATGLTLFRGDRSIFYDHPGAPLQEGLGVVFTGAWLLGGADGSRAERSLEWVQHLDSTRAYLRSFGAFMFVAAGLLAFFTIAWVLRSALWGLVGALLALSSPDVIAWSSVVKPDSLLVGLSIAVTGLLVEAFRRRSGPLYLAAAFVLGFDLSVKVHAAALALPFVVALVWRPPPAGWWTAFRRDARRWLSQHRRLVLAVGCVWLALVLLLGVLGAPPQAKPLLEAVVGTAVLVALGAGAWRLARQTRFAGLAAAAIGSVFACLAGLVVPNLLFWSFPAPMLRQMAITLTGGGVNTGAHPELNPWNVLESWRPFLLVAAVGVVLAVRRREWEMLLWGVAAFGLGLLAFLRYGEFHYYAAAIGVAAPLVVYALRAIPVARPALALALAGLILFQPYRDEIDRAQARGEVAERTQRVNEWVEPRLRPGEAALTYLESDDSRHLYIVDFYSPWNTERDYQFVPPGPEGEKYVRERGLRIAYVIAGGPTDATALVREFGTSGRATRVGDAPGFVYRVER